MQQQSKKIPTRIGLIGIGLVGKVLAEHFLKHGIDVVGYDLDADRRTQFEQMGGRCATGPQELAQSVTHVVLSLPDSEVVRDVIEGPHGLLAAENRPSYVIDTSTGDPEDTARLGQELAESGVSLLDATICGASSQLQKRAAVLMVGGEPSSYEACADVLGLLAKHVFYLGPSGSGSKAKLATNLVLGLNRLVLAEGMVFAETLGLPLETFLELLKVSPAYSAAVDVKGEKMLRSDFDPVSRIRQHHKDVSLMLKQAQQHRQQLPLSTLHRDILDGAMAAGDGDLDTSAVIRELRRRTIDETHPKEARP